MKPKRGFRSLLEVEFAGLFGQISFMRYGYLNSFYTPLWKGGTMKYRFDFRFIQPILNSPAFKDIPLSERFFMGGENTVRGYKAFDLGPHYENGDPTGGISSGLVSFEYLHQVYRLIDLFAFADAGSISRRTFNFGTYRFSYGVGTRLELINRVPIILGIGFPVNPDTRSEVRRFFFSMGGQF